MSIAICPGSFDPITLGHLNIIRRTSRIFDQVVVCIMHNAMKPNPMFTVEEKVEMCRRATERYPNVTVDWSDGLLAEYAKQYPGAVIVKGLRAASDFEYEFQRALLLKKINEKLETVFIMTNANYSYISSSGVRELLAFGGDIGKLVPANVAELIYKYHKRKTK